jgi:hypothetical protein
VPERWPLFGRALAATMGSAGIGFAVGVMTSVLVIGFTLKLLNSSATRVYAQQIANVEVTSDMKVQGLVTYNGKSYEVLSVLGSRTIPNGRYYYDPAAKQEPGARHGCRHAQLGSLEVAVEPAGRGKIGFRDRLELAQELLRGGGPAVGALDREVGQEPVVLVEAQVGGGRGAEDEQVGDDLLLDER